MAFFDFVGATSGFASSLASIPLPAGTAVGDFAVVVVNYSGSAAITDPRLAVAALGVNRRYAGWGVLDTLDPIAVSCSGDTFGRHYGISVFRQTTAAELVTTLGKVAGDPIPTISNSVAAVMVIANLVQGAVSGGPASISGWTQRCDGYGARRGIGIYSWSSVIRTSTPSANLPAAGTDADMGIVLLRVEDSTPYVQPSTAYIYDEAASLLKPLNASEAISTG